LFGIVDQLTEEERKKKKKKVRLEMHLEQCFADNLDAYVWIYDPIPMHYWLFGALVVLAAIGICMFPLWPSSVRYALG
jgi:translocation protein SEC62